MPCFKNLKRSKQVLPPSRFLWCIRPMTGSARFRPGSVVKGNEYACHHAQRDALHAERTTTTQRGTNARGRACAPSRTSAQRTTGSIALLPYRRASSITAGALGTSGGSSRNDPHIARDQTPSPIACTRVHTRTALPRAPQQALRACTCHQIRTQPPRRAQLLRHPGNAACSPRARMAIWVHPLAPRQPGSAHGPRTWHTTHLRTSSAARRPRRRTTEPCT
ncbi:hypothetical protein B0H10DRAFT_2113121 [Mycena sp. CBHHK59/15]|nr:hypothetical protein B0H10DRAFT_2113121 [Mycena sp. CBHHK59/15]